MGWYHHIHHIHPIHIPLISPCSKPPTSLKSNIFTAKLYPAVSTSWRPCQVEPPHGPSLQLKAPAPHPTWQVSDAEVQGRLTKDLGLKQQKCGIWLTKKDRLKQQRLHRKIESADQLGLWGRFIPQMTSDWWMVFRDFTKDTSAAWLLHH